MIPILYEKNETDFAHNGIGFLTDTIRCEVIEERNGVYELTLQYPITGQWYKEIKEGCIIKAKANETSDLQLFRIYKSGKPINGIVTFNAEHISYDLNGIPLESLSVTGTPAVVLSTGFNNALLPHSFSAWSDIDTANTVNFTKPNSLRSILGGQEGSILDVFGGEYEFDNFIVKLHKQRGEETQVVIEYGKNLTDINQEKNIAECYTHLFPYAVISVDVTDSQGTIVDTTDCVITLSEKVIQLIDPAGIGHTKCLNMDFTEYFAENEEITEAKLRAKATAYIEANNLTAPKINITASFVQLWQTAEYANIAPLERVRLCDTVTIRFTELGIDATAKVIKTTYDSLKEKYISIELGDAKSNFANTVLKQQSGIDGLVQAIRTGKAQTSAELKNAILTATNLITGQSGGFVVLNPPNNPQEILIMDSPNIATAVNVWRWNSAGLGHSSSGYNGPYETAMLMNGSIVADFIKTGVLDGGLIAGKTINGEAIIAGTINSEAIAQSFKDEISQEIEETTTGKLSQTAEQFNLQFLSLYKGGTNLLRNSSGLNGVDDNWTVIGTVLALQDSDTKNRTVSNSCFQIKTGAKLSQTVENLVSGKSYTITLLCKKPDDYHAYIKLIHDGIETYVLNSDDEFDWTEFSATVDNVSSSLTFEAYTDGVSLFLADIMLTEGTSKAHWTPAPNEIYTSGVKVDRNGVEVYNKDSQQKTRITNTEFAGYYGEDKVFYLNKDEFHLTKGVAESLQIGKLKIYPKDNPGVGVNIVLLD